MILGRVEVRDRDLGCVGLIILAQGSHRSLRVKIPAFQPFGYQTAPVSALFGGLGRFHHPEHQRWGWNFRECTDGFIPVLRVPVQLLSGRFGDPETSFAGCGDFALLVVVDFPVPIRRRVG